MCVERKRRRIRPRPTERRARRRTAAGSAAAPSACSASRPPTVRAPTRSAGQRTCQGDHTCAETTPRRERPPNPMPPATARRRSATAPAASMSVADDTDKPDDGDACTADVCTNGVPSNPDLPRGTLCATDGSKACDGTRRVQRAHVPRRARRHRQRRADGGSRRRPSSRSGAPTARLVGTGRAADRGGRLEPAADDVGDVDLGRRSCRCPATGTTWCSPATRRAAGAGTGVNVRRDVGDGQSRRRPRRRGGHREHHDLVHARPAAPTTRAARRARTDRSSGSRAPARAGSGGVWYNPLGATGGETRRVASCRRPGNVRVVAIFANQLYGSSSAERSPTCSRSASARRSPRTRPPPRSRACRPAARARTRTRCSISRRRPRRRHALRRGQGTHGRHGGLQKWTFNGTTWTPGRDPEHRHRNAPATVASPATPSADGHA